MVTLKAYPRDASGTITAHELSFERVDVVRRHLKVGSWAMVLKSQTDADLVASPGAGVVFTVNGTVVMSGPVQNIQVSYKDGKWEWTLQGADDALLLDVTGWPVPGNAIGSQTSSHWTATDAAETVMKDFVTDNVVTRLGVGVTVASDSAQGSTITGRSRFGSVLEKLHDWGMSGGVGWSVVDSGSGPVFDVWTTTDRTGTVLFSAQPGGGALLGLTYTRAMPEATRVVVGGAGDNTSRTFRADVDSADETAWGIVRERLVDTRQTSNTTELDQSASEFLDENGETASASFTLLDVPGQQYGVHYELGDTVPVLVAGTTTVSDVVWEVQITWTEQDGLRVAPTVGKPDEAAATGRLRALGKALRQLQEAQ